MAERFDQTLASFWADWEHHCVHAGLSAQAIRSAKGTFYSGALAALKILEGVGIDVPANFTRSVFVFHVLEEEVSSFIREFRKEVEADADADV